MKKKILFLTVGILIAGVLYATLVKSTFNKKININASISLIHREISSLDKIARWYLPFASADTNTNKIVMPEKIAYNNATLKITRLTGLSAWYQVSENNTTKDIAFSIMVDTANSSSVTLSYTTTLWKYMVDGSSIITNAKKSLQNLQDYFADTKKMYGYQMEITTITSDTAFLFTSKIVAKAQKKTAFKNLFESLIQRATEKDLGYNGVRIFYASPYGNDSIHLFTSIGITHTQDVGFTGEYTLKKMPNGGKLLSAYYQGSFGNVQHAVDALDQFEADNSMTKMAIPFIKLITEGNEFDDSQIIQAKAYYPVF